MGKNSKARRDAKKKKLKNKSSDKNTSKNTSILLLNKERQKYLREWENGNSKKFEEDGHYKWMSGFLKGYTKVLEIGTGDGRSTLQLVNDGHKVISVDENPFCLDSAEVRLKEHHINYIRLKRESIKKAGSDQYSISYSNLPSDLSKYDVVLCESDFINDNLFRVWLDKSSPYDAVICWLIGTHGARIFHNKIDPNETPTPMHYRLKVQNQVYKVANDILRKNGILHVVDRGRVPNTEILKQDLIDAHNDQASVTNLEVTDFSYRLYDEPQNTEAVEMCLTITEHTQLSDMSQLSFYSIISTKKDG